MTAASVKAQGKKLTRSIKGRYWYKWVNHGCPVCAAINGHKERRYYSEELPNDDEEYTWPTGCPNCFG